MKPVEEFLRELAEEWTHSSRPTLKVIGSTALLLRTAHNRGTKDSDILETIDLDQVTKAQLLAIGGPDTVLHKKWRVYLDVVLNGLPFIPPDAIWHAVEIPGAPSDIVLPGTGCDRRGGE